MIRIPVGQELVCEYRGLGGKAGEFVDRDTGEVVSYTPKLRFEFEGPDGVVEVIEIRTKKLAEVASFDVDGLQRGEHVRISGVVVVRDDGGYFAPSEVSRCKADGKPLAAAA